VLGLQNEVPANGIIGNLHSRGKHLLHAFNQCFHVRQIAGSKGVLNCKGRVAQLGPLREFVQLLSACARAFPLHPSSLHRSVGEDLFPNSRMGKFIAKAAHHFAKQLRFSIRPLQCSSYIKGSKLVQACRNRRARPPSSARLARCSVPAWPASI
jgi:hypothetical protein